VGHRHPDEFLELVAVEVAGPIVDLGDELGLAVVDEHRLVQAAKEQQVLLLALLEVGQKLLALDQLTAQLDELGVLVVVAGRAAAWRIGAGERDGTQGVPEGRGHGFLVSLPAASGLIARSRG